MRPEEAHEHIYFVQHLGISLPPRIEWLTSELRKSLRGVAPMQGFRLTSSLTKAYVLVSNPQALIKDSEISSTAIGKTIPNDVDRKKIEIISLDLTRGNGRCLMRVSSS